MVANSATAMIVALVAMQGGREGIPGEPSPRVMEARVLDEGPGIPDPVMPARQISYEIRIAQLKGFDWRNRLQGGAERGESLDGSRVWVVDSDLLAVVLRDWSDSTASNLVQTPKMTMVEGARGRVGNTSDRFFVVDLERIADGPPGEATAVAFKPIVEKVRDGIVIDVSSTPGVEGHLVDAEVVETRVERVHTHRFMDGVKGDPETGTKPANLQATYQIPEVSQARAAGSWEVPEGMHVIVALPPRTSSEKGRLGMTKDVIEERVVVITPRVVGQELAKAGP